MVDSMAASDDLGQKLIWKKRKQNLRAIMAYKGWKDSPLSLAAGLSKNAVNTLLRSETLPKYSTLESICRVLGLNSVSMLDAENPMSVIRNDLFGMVQSMGEDQAREALDFLREKFPDLQISDEGKNGD